MVNGSIACDDDVPTTLRYMYEHNIYVDALPSVFTTYMELEQAGFHSDEPWLSIESAIKGLHQIEIGSCDSKPRCMVKATLQLIQRNTVDNLADQSNIVENRQPVQRVDDDTTERTVALMLKVENIRFGYVPSVDISKT